jgi:cold-inducible RNA-binding protein
LIAREQPTIKQYRHRRNVVKNLFVGNLDSEVSQDELRWLFDFTDKAVRVHIIRDRDTGLPRGFAFVEITNVTEAEREQSEL